MGDLHIEAIPLGGGGGGGGGGRRGCKRACLSVCVSGVHLRPSVEEMMHLYVCLLVHLWGIDISFLLKNCGGHTHSARTPMHWCEHRLTTKTPLSIILSMHFLPCPFAGMGAQAITAQ